MKPEWIAGSNRLADVLKRVRLTGAQFLAAAGNDGWGASGRPKAAQFEAVPPPGTGRVIGFQVVIQGSGRVRLDPADWMEVPAGHAVVVTRGGAHGPCDRPGRKVVPFDALPGGSPECLRGAQRRPVQARNEIDRFGAPMR